MKRKNKPINYPAFCFEDSGYETTEGGDFWKATTLYDAAKEQKCKVYRLPIEHIDLSDTHWKGVGNVDSLAYHYKRTMATDLKYPVLVGPLGNIMDGWHRILKALIEGKTFVKAIRLDSVPEPDETRGDK